MTGLIVSRFVLAEGAQPVGGTGGSVVHPLAYRMQTTVGSTNDTGATDVPHCGGCRLKKRPTEMSTSRRTSKSWRYWLSICC